MSSLYAVDYLKRKDELHFDFDDFADAELSAHTMHAQTGEQIGIWLLESGKPYSMYAIVHEGETFVNYVI